jgi:hypothetical protein
MFDWIIFNFSDKDNTGFMDFTNFIILNCQLNNGKTHDPLLLLKPSAFVFIR